ncbi:MAG: hypothetical protein K6T28_10165 [Acidothermus sp.]|nr:hypothetical protein [Acidothermus sp.]
MLFGLDLDRRSRRWLKHAGRRAFISRLISPWGRRWVDPETWLGRLAARRARWGRQRAAAAAGRPHHDADLLEAGLRDVADAVLAERATVDHATAEVEPELVAPAATTPRLRDALAEVGPPPTVEIVSVVSPPRAPARLRLASVR